MRDQSMLFRRTISIHITFVSMRDKSMQHRKSPHEVHTLPAHNSVETYLFHPFVHDSKRIHERDDDRFAEERELHIGIDAIKCPSRFRIEIVLYARCVWSVV